MKKIFLSAVRKHVFPGRDAIRKCVFFCHWRRKIMFCHKKRIPQIAVFHPRLCLGLQFTCDLGHSLLLQPRIKIYYLYYFVKFWTKRKSGFSFGEIIELKYIVYKKISYDLIVKSLKSFILFEFNTLSTKLKCINNLNEVKN